jgi:hypothetical protein
MRGWDCKGRRKRRKGRGLEEGGRKRKKYSIRYK